MTKKPTLANVANQAGVSIATASQVLRGTGRISDTTRNLVKAAAKKLNYVPDARAASMRSGANHEIGLSIHKIANRFNAEIISGASDLLEDEGYLLSVLDARDDVVRQRKQLEAFIRSSRGGLIWVPAADTPESTFDLLNTHGLPSVTFLRRPEFGELDHVGIENAAATFAATNHLLDLGHTKIAYLGGEANVDVRSERIEGCRKALNARGIDDIHIVDCQDSRSAGIEAMHNLMNQHPEVTAVVCNGDMVAIGASLAIGQVGMRPGREISVVGFDDTPDAKYATYPLTTLAVSPYELGRKLARVLLERMNEPNMPPSTTLVPAKLVERETTGAPPAK